MIALRAALALAVALGVQIVLGLWAPSLTRWVDVLTLPVAWYALAVSQRAGLLVGCAAGLLQDAWLQAELFGASGFSKSVLGWALGGLAARFELNVAWGRATAGALLPVLDRLVVLGLRALFDRGVVPPDPVELGVRAVAGALLTLGVFATMDRVLKIDPRRGRRARPPR
jgi:cell shape-determining protein MreD